MRRATKILLILIGIAFNGMGQVPYFQHILLLKKNEPVQVNAMIQDSEGLIWYGTNRGLFKFDGITTTHYTLSDSLPSLEVTALAEDSLGRIWTGHKTGALATFENGRFHAFNPREGTSSNEISDILFDHKGHLWFSTLNDGLYYFIDERLYRLDEDNGMPDMFVYDITEDKSGTIWAGTDGGIAACTPDGKKATITTYDQRNGLPDNIEKKIFIEQNGTLWIGTEDAGIIQYDPSSEKSKPLIQNWRFGSVTDFVLIDDKAWISSQLGLLVFDRQMGQVKLFNANAGTGFTSVQVLLQDREHNIWAGTKTEVMRTRGDLLEFIDKVNPSNDGNTLAIAVDKQQAQWYSTSEGLFMRTIDETGKARIRQPLKGTSFQRYTIISLYADPEGQIWAGLYGEGALRINPKTMTVRHLNRELRNGNVLNIAGTGNTLWLATLGGGTRVDIAGDKLTVRNYSSEDGLVSDYIYQVFPDTQGRVWFATDGKGVDMLDTGGFHHYSAGLESKVVYGFTEDSQHRIWVNAQGQGLYVLEGETFRAFSTTGAQIRDNNISCFSATDAGNLFIMHDFGIDIYDVARDKVYYLGEEAGLDDREPNLNAISKDKYGSIYAGTSNGIVKYSDPHLTQVYAPAPLIRRFVVSGQDFSLLPKQKFNYDQNDVTIGYIGLWYQNALAVSYRYQLENFDREWISSQNSAATYSSLAPGTYTFTVKASDTGDFSEANAASITFTIQPPFWRTSWFYGLSGLGSIFLIYSFIQYRERRLRRDKQQLEAKVEERTLEIIKKNEEIHAQAEEIKGINENLEGLVQERTRELERKNQALEEYAFINAHELRAPVASILGLVNLMQSMETDEEERLYLEHLKTSAEKLDDVVRSIGKAIEKGESSSS